MFFREKKTSSKPTLQLVESYRNARGKVSQRVVVSLAGCWVSDELPNRVATAALRELLGARKLGEPAEQLFLDSDFRNGSRAG